MTYDQIVAAYWAAAIFLIGVSLLAVSKRMERKAAWRRMALLELRITAERNLAQRYDDEFNAIIAGWEDDYDEPTVELCGLVDDEYLPSLAEQAIEIPREGAPE